MCNINDIRIARINKHIIKANDMFWVATCNACGFTYESRSRARVSAQVEKHIGAVVRVGKARGQRVIRVARNVVNDKREEWKRFVKDNALELLGAGASRTVYALDDKRVLKIEHADFRGMSQCEIESNYWKNASDKIRPMLAEVYESGNGWLIMERGKQTLSKMFANGGHEIQKALAHETRINDLHAHNIAYFGGGVFKIIDYGLAI